MQFRKKLGVLVTATALMALSASSTVFADSQLIVSEEGIGVEVYSPKWTRAVGDNDIDANYTSVSGGTLWTTWRKEGSLFRANYDHSSKKHRCTAQNADGVISRSGWMEAGDTARSGFIKQTMVGNKSYAAVE